MARRFRFARIDGPPGCWHMLKIIDLSTGEPISMVIAANADEGWVERYASDDDGMPVRSNNGGWVREILKGMSIDIVIDESIMPKGFNPDINNLDDIEAGVIYEDDITADEMSQLMNGKPRCLCGRCPMPRPGMKCDFCDMVISKREDGHEIRDR